MRGWSDEKDIDYYIIELNCKLSTQHGKCVGIYNDDEKKSHLKYEFSMRNAIWTFLGIETIIAPIVWLLYGIECPEEIKKENEK